MTNSNNRLTCSVLQYITDRAISGPWTVNVCCSMSEKNTPDTSQHLHLKSSVLLKRHTQAQPAISMHCLSLWLLFICTSPFPERHSNLPGVSPQLLEISIFHSGLAISTLLSETLTLPTHTRPGDSAAKTLRSWRMCERHMPKDNCMQATTPGWHLGKPKWTEIHKFTRPFAL